jgi:hypothetical protein
MGEIIGKDITIAITNLLTIFNFCKLNIKHYSFVLEINE